MRKYLLMALVLGACSGDSPKNTTPDAPLNQAFGAKCGTASDTSAECMSGVCTDSFDMLGYSICSQKCTMFMAPDPSCPAGTSQMCNKKGYCKP
jgi:hypothetical protein